MRPGQNNKQRMRGRNNNRKGPSPLSRAYESNGPDVKIRGTAQHVAEKYLQLARDAQSSGDPVAAENLLQHAEHYFRLIAAAQAQLQPQYGKNGEEIDEGDDDDDFVALPDRFASPVERAPIPPVAQPQQNGGQMGYGAQPQPYFERPAFNTDGNERPVERQERQDRNFDRGANPNGERQDRQPRNDRRFGQQGERTGGERPQGERPQGQGRNRFRDQQPRFDAGSSGQEQPRVDFEPLTTALPAFITAPTRLPVLPSPQQEDANASAGQPPSSLPPSSLPVPTAPPENVAAPGDDDGENRFHLRPRRRRRPRADAGENGDAGESGNATPQPETSSAD